MTIPNGAGHTENVIMNHRDHQQFGRAGYWPQSQLWEYFTFSISPCCSTQHPVSKAPKSRDQRYLANSFSQHRRELRRPQPLCSGRTFLLPYAVSSLLQTHVPSVHGSKLAYRTLGSYRTVCVRRLPNHYHNGRRQGLVNAI